MKLSVIDAVRVASPCRADWNAMTGDDRVRACSACKQQVFDLSGMTRPEADALLARRGEVCVRYYRRPDGTILLADCRVGVIAAPSRKLLAVGAAALLATAVAHQLAGSSPAIDGPSIDSPAEALDNTFANTAPNDPPPVARPSTHHMRPRREDLPIYWMGRK